MLELERVQREEWLKQGVDVPMGDPSDASWAATVVVVDAQDKPVICMGARRVAELGMTLDAKQFEIHDLRNVLARAWAKLAVALFRQGYDSVFARVTSPTPKWGNMLVRRAQFERTQTPHYYFDLEKHLGGLKPNVDQ